MIKPFEPSSNYFDLPFRHKQIVPIPVTYCKSQQKLYDSKFNQAFAMRGYKNIHRIAAVGHRTDENLMRIKKSCLKMVKSLEFDAYLCDTSALKTLYQVLKKSKGTITDLNLIIRRIGLRTEIENLSYLLYRIIRMKKLRIEIASVEKVDGRVIEALTRSFKRCFSLRVFEARLIDIPTLSQIHLEKLGLSFAKIPNLKELIFDVQTFFSPKNSYEGFKYGLANFKKAKKIELGVRRKTGWTSMKDGAGEALSFFVNSFQRSMDPTELSLIFSNYPLSSEGAQEIAKMFPVFQNMRSFRLNLSNCQLGELELMILAEGFTHCKQLKVLNFKHKERSQVNAECLLDFVKIVSSLSFLLDFDLFFRKLRYSEFERAELKEKLSEVEGIKYVLTKESLHVYKRGKSEGDNF